MTAILLYIVVYAALGVVYAPKNLIRKIFNGGLIPYSWFVVCILPVGLLFMALFLVHGKLVNSINKPVFEYAYCFAESVLFVAMLLLISFKVSVGNRILKLLGECSFEIYLYQGLFIKIIFNTKKILSNGFLYALLCIVSTILLAMLMHFINTKMFQVKRIVAKTV